MLLRAPIALLKEVQKSIACSLKKMCPKPHSPVFARGVVVGLGGHYDLVLYIYTCACAYIDMCISQTLSSQ